MSPIVEAVGRSVSRARQEVEALQAAAKQRRVAGGKSRNAAREAEAAKFWEPYLEEYRKRLASGQDYLVARDAVGRLMVNDGHTKRSRPTLRKWLPDPSG